MLAYAWEKMEFGSSDVLLYRVSSTTEMMRCWYMDTGCLVPCIFSAPFVFRKGNVSLRMFKYHNKFQWKLKRSCSWTGKDLGGARKEAKARKKSWMRRQVGEERRFVFFCSSLTQLQKAAVDWGSSAGRRRAGTEEKEADGQGISAYGGCRVFLLGGQRCILGKSCRAEFKEQKPGLCTWWAETSRMQPWVGRGTVGTQLERREGWWLENAPARVKHPGFKSSQSIKISQPGNSSYLVQACRGNAKVFSLSWGSWSWDWIRDCCPGEGRY